MRRQWRRDPRNRAFLRREQLRALHTTHSFLTGSRSARGRTLDRVVDEADLYQYGGHVQAGENIETGLPQAPTVGGAQVEL